MRYEAIQGKVITVIQPDQIPQYAQNGYRVFKADMEGNREELKNPVEESMRAIKSSRGVVSGGMMYGNTK